MAFDAFLKIDGIEGSGPDGTIEVLSFSWGLGHPGSEGIGNGDGSGRAVLSDLSVMKTLDKASPKLFQSCANGTHIPEATLALSKARGEGQRQTFLILKLDQVIISSANSSGSKGGGDLPTESVSLSFQKWDLAFNPGT